MKTRLYTLALACAAAFSTVHLAHAAGIDDPNVDARFRAKILKEKAKQNGLNSQNFNFNSQNGSQQNPQCGSQNIGNVDTGGRIGAQPREVFVFAPNSINVVSGNACQ